MNKSQESSIKFEGSTLIDVSNRSLCVTRVIGGQWKIESVTPAGQTPDGYYYLAESFNPAKSVAPQDFQGTVIYLDREFVYQLGDVVKGKRQIARHNKSLFGRLVTAPKVGTVYWISYVHGKGEIKTENGGPVQLK